MFKKQKKIHQRSSNSLWDRILVADSRAEDEQLSAASHISCTEFGIENRCTGLQTAEEIEQGSQSDGKVKLVKIKPSRRNRSRVGPPLEPETKIQGHGNGFTQDSLKFYSHILIRNQLQKGTYK